MYSTNTLAVASAVIFLTACGILEEGTSDPVRMKFNDYQESPAIAVALADEQPAMAQANTKAAKPSASDRSITQIFQTSRCNDLSHDGFIWFTNEASLSEWLNPLSQDLAGEIISQINFAQQGVLLLDFGMQATPGSGFEMVSQQLRIDNGEGVVVIKKLKPPIGKKQVQMVTHPCALYAMPRNGYDFLALFSELGDPLMSFDNRQQ